MKTQIIMQLKKYIFERVGKEKHFKKFCYTNGKASIKQKI